MVFNDRDDQMAAGPVPKHFPNQKHETAIAKSLSTFALTQTGLFLDFPDSFGIFLQGRTAARTSFCDAGVYSLMTVQKFRQQGFFLRPPHGSLES